MRKIFFVITLVITLVFYTLSIHSQTFVPTLIQVSQYPEITVKAYAFNAAGVRIPVPNPELKINGQSLQTTSEQEEGVTERSVSCMVMVDQSASQTIGTPPNSELSRAAAAAVPLYLNAVSDQIGLGMFDARPTLLHGMTTDKSAYISALSNLALGSGCNLDSALFANPEGAFTHLRSGRYSKAMILILDGAPRFNVADAIRIARGHNIAVYIIGIRTVLTNELRSLADSSGGLYCESINDQSDATAYVQAFICHAKRLPATLIKATAGATCEVESRLDIVSGATTRTQWISLPPGSLAELEWSEAGGIDFGTGAAEGVRTVSLTARNGNVTINSLTINSPAFYLDSPNPAGQVLQQNQTIQIRIGYRGGSEGAWGEVQLTSSACINNRLTLRAGGYTTGQSLRLVSPNGGERLLAGRPTTIQWTNVLESDIVRLESSTDDGATWGPITEFAQGLQFQWTPGPETSSQMKIRVMRTVLPPQAVITMSGHREPVYSVAFTYNGQYIITGGHDRTVRLWNATTGAQVRELGSHANFAWAVATHPSQDIGASGSHDGTVRVYELQSGVRLMNINAPSRVWSMDFSPNGEHIVVGGDKSLAVYDWKTGTLINNIVVDGGPVYSARYSNDGTLLVTAEASAVVLRSTSTFETIRTIDTGPSVVYCADISNDNTVVVSGGADFVVRTWNATTGTPIHATKASTAAILNVDISPSSQTFVAAGGDGSAKLYRTSTLELLNSLSTGPNILYGCRYDNTGNRVATAGTDSDARVWNLQGATLAQDVSDATFSVVSGLPVLNDVNHGTVKLGDASERRATVIVNAGPDSLWVNGWRLVSGDLNDFDILTPALPTILPPNGATIVETIAQPIATGNRTALMEVSVAGGIVPVNITANSVNQDLVVPDVVNFGRRLAGQDVVDTTINIRAVAAQGVSVTRTVLSGVQSSAYQVLSGGGAYTLTAGQSRQIVFRFTPETAGRFAAWVELHLSDGSVRTIRLYGEGTGNAQIHSSAQTLLFSNDACTNTPTTQEITVSNRGSSALLIYAVEVIGSSSDEFRIVPNISLPITLASNETASIAIEFNPTRVSEKSAVVSITSNAINAPNGITQIQIVARKDSVGFDLSATNVTFANVQEGQSAEQRITIFNTGSVPLRWPSTGTDIGAFRVEAANPPITAPGGTSEVTIRFKGGVVGSSYAETFVFSDTICNRSIQISLEATIRSYIGCTITIDQVSAAIGSTVNVPIRLTDKVNFDRTQVTEMKAYFRVNGSILTPTNTASTFHPNGSRTFEVTIPTTAQGDVAATIPFNVTWGNDTASVVAIDSVLVSDTIVVKVNQGKVLLSDLCREGGPRLLLRERDRFPSNAVRRPAEARIVPMPVHHDATVDLHIVEDGPTRLELVDATGRIVRTLVDKELTIGNYLIPFDTNDLETGTYTMSLVTRTQHMSHRITVIK